MEMNLDGVAVATLNLGVDGMFKKYIQKMWLIHDVLFFDLEKAQEVEDGKDVAKAVFVGINDDGIELPRDGISAEYFGSWIYRDEEMLKKEIEEYNRD